MRVSSTRVAGLSLASMGSVCGQPGSGEAAGVQFGMPGLAGAAGAAAPALAAAAALASAAAACNSLSQCSSARAARGACTVRCWLVRYRGKQVQAAHLHRHKFGRQVGDSRRASLLEVAHVCVLCSQRGRLCSGEGVFQAVQAASVPGLHASLALQAAQSWRGQHRGCANADRLERRGAAAHRQTAAASGGGP